MKWQKRVSRTLALATAVALLATQPAAAAGTIGDGVTPTYDEAYYATVDYYGNLTQGSVVKSYTLNGASQIVDYGTYNSVDNLTDGTAPSVSSGRVCFDFGGSAPDHFYFEGSTTQPFQDLPWTISMSYRLNGVPTRAEDLAGQTGVVEIDLNFVPNEGASSYARNNYTLEAMALFNQDDILSLKAEGAQVQLVGNLRMVLFLCLPGEEQHFTIEVGSNEFSFEGMTFLMVPATLSQLEQIADISQKKDDLEDDYHKLSGSFDQLLSAMGSLTGSLNSAAAGLDVLNGARGTFSDGKDVLYEGTDLLKGDLEELAELLDPVTEQIQVLSQTVTDSKVILNSMTDTALSLQLQLRDLEAALENLEDGTGDVKELMERAADLENSLNSLKRALNSVSGGSITGDSGLDESTSSRTMVKKVKEVRALYDAPLASFITKMLILQGTDSAEAEATGAQLAQLAQLPSPPSQELQGAWTTAKTFQGMQALSFQKFCETLLPYQYPDMSASEIKDLAKQMNDLWIVYSSGSLESGETSGGTSGGSQESGTAPTPDQSQPGETEDQGQADEGQEGTQEGALPGQDQNEEEQEGTVSAPDLQAAGLAVGSRALMRGTLGRVMVGVGGVDTGIVGDGGASSDGDGGQEGTGSTGDNQDNTGSAGDNQDNDTGSTGGGQDNTAGGTGDGQDNTTGDQEGTGGSQEGTPGTGDASDENGTVGGAVIDLITGGLDSAMASISAIQNELNSTIRKITRPTAVVVGDLEDLCGQIDNVIDLLDDAEDLSAAVRQSSKKIRAILDDADALRNTLNDYEPTLQETLGTVSGLGVTAAATVRDTVSLIDSAEDLLRRSGAQLDSGTEKTLEALASVLRRTANVMATTSDIQTSKDAMTGIIEELWNDHTGEVDNLLMMDATAQAESLTDSRNGTPQSVQVLIRSQEIKVDEEQNSQEVPSAGDNGTFWSRVAQMFKDFWAAITGIFH